MFFVSTTDLLINNAHIALTPKASELCVLPPHLWWGVQCRHTGHVELKIKTRVRLLPLSKTTCNAL
jgi:hypothetical protein